MMPAAKQFDMVMGVDIHIVQPPGPVPPVPIPHPFIGMVFDPVDFIPKVGATVFVNGIPRAQAGTGAKDIPPHIPIGGMFIKPPGNEGEMFMGSATVLVDGSPFTFTACQVLSCHDIGMPAPPRKKAGAKSMMLPTSVVLPIPGGPPVLVGGPPTIDLQAMAMKMGMKVAGKLAKKLGGLAKKAASKVANAAKKAAKKAAAAAKKFAAGVKARLAKLKCKFTGHPVNVADGSVNTSIVDFTLPGPIPLEWSRDYFSNTVYDGPLGHGWHHPYDLTLELMPHDKAAALSLPEGRIVGLPLVAEGESFFEREEKITFGHDKYGFYFRDENLLTHRFAAKVAATPEILYLETIADYGGNAIRFDHDARGTLVRITDSAGRVLPVYSDEKGRITCIAADNPDKPGELFAMVTYKYDQQGDLTEALDGMGMPMRYEYHNHLLVREINRAGLSFYFQYDGKDHTARCVRTWGDGGIYDHKLTFLEGMTVVEDSLGHKTTYHHTDGLVWKTVDPLGGATIITYNEFNEIVSEKNALGFGPMYDYDDRGNRILNMDASGGTVRTEYNDLSLPVKAMDAAGGNWAWEYNDKGNLLLRKDPTGRETRYVYNEKGEVTEITNPTGGKTTIGYDSAGNLNMVVTPDGQTSWWGYDTLGRCVETIDAKGNSQRRMFDILGRVTEIREPDGNVRTFRYDPEGHVVHAKDKQNDIRFAYSGLGAMVAREENNTRVEFRYDKEERLTGIVNEHSAAYQLVLDAKGDVREEIGFDGLRRIYVRDLAGKVAEVLRPSGIKTFYEYDASGRVTAVKHSDGSGETFSYREDGELLEAKNEHISVRFERDVLGRPVKESQGGFTITSEYDLMGYRTALNSSLGANLAIRRNIMGDVEAVSSGAWQAQFRRDNFGLELEREMTGGIRSRWQRDKLGRPVKQETYTGGGSNLQRARHYRWDMNDRLKEISDSTRGATRFEHDAFGNLASAQNPDGSFDFRMPDAVGNLFRTQNRSDRRYGPAGQLLQSGNTRYEYDAEGNLSRKTEGNGKTWLYEWNAAGMLRRVVRPDGDAVTFTYDALGRRISKSYRGKTTRWVWDGNTPLHEWVETGIADWKPDPAHTPAETPADVTTWVFEPDSFAPLAKLTAARACGIVTDHLGTPTTMFDANGQSLWQADLNIYGERKQYQGKAEDCPFRFPGQYEDVETGLYYNRFRYYDAEGGMYVSQDPIGVFSGTLDFYAYVSDSNIYYDVLGLQCVKDILRDVGPLTGKKKADIQKLLQEKGFQKTTARNGGEIWTKAGSDGNTASVRLDPAKQRPKPKGFADEKPHAHKETVPSNKVNNGNYEQSDASTFDDSVNPSNTPAATHIHIDDTP